jgi:hypothetical protein
MVVGKRGWDALPGWGFSSARWVKITHLVGRIYP